MVNLKTHDAREQIAIDFAECSNTPQTTTRMAVKVFVRQSSGGLFQPPPVTVAPVLQPNVHWCSRSCRGEATSIIWMQRVRQNDRDFLKVFIRHEAPDSKPSGSDWEDYRCR
jgi:hypothetical protein